MQRFCSFKFGREIKMAVIIMYMIFEEEFKNGKT